MNDELKPVPCGCGGEAKVIKHEYFECSPTYGVTCYKCRTATNQGFDTEAEAVEAWNRAMGATDICVGDKERTTMVWKPAKGRPVYEKGICGCGYVLSVLQRDFVYCPMCGARLEWG